MEFYFGTHMAVDLDNIIQSIKDVEKIGGNICQIFVTKPLHKNVSFISDNQLFDVKKYLIENKLKLVIHSSYMLNFARVPFLNNKPNWAINNLINELVYASKLGAIGCVIHFGKHLEFSREVGLENMYRSLSYVIKKMPKNVLIILETSSGQGTELGYDIEEFYKLYNMFNKKEKERLGICIDTCHIFAAGYDIRREKQVKKFFELFFKYFSLDKIVLCHLNDSKKGLGEKKDRHESIGLGKIGWEGLRTFIEICYKYKIPIILETPSINYKKEINLIKETINHIR